MKKKETLSLRLKTEYSEYQLDFSLIDRRSDEKPNAFTKRVELYELFQNSGQLIAFASVDTSSPYNMANFKDDVKQQLASQLVNYPRLFAAVERRLDNLSFVETMKFYENEMPYKD